MGELYIAEIKMSSLIGYKSNLYFQQSRVFKYPNWRIQFLTGV
jgi:hypothetical protein